MAQKASVPERLRYLVREVPDGIAGRLTDGELLTRLHHAHHLRQVGSAMVGRDRDVYRDRAKAILRALPPAELDDRLLDLHEAASHAGAREAEELHAAAYALLRENPMPPAFHYEEPLRGMPPMPQAKAAAGRRSVLDKRAAVVDKAAAGRRAELLKKVAEYQRILDGLARSDRAARDFYSLKLHVAMARWRRETGS